MRNNITLSKRLSRERKTISHMIGLYCRDHHGHKRVFCQECRELNQYAEFRLGLCIYGDHKPTCSKCPIHCYKPGAREQIKNVMRYSGPRMLKNHPILALQHILDSFRKVPLRKDPLKK